MTQAFKISNSEVSQLTQCERSHYYGFGLGIEPKQHGLALNRGLIGHDVLATYYQTLQDGKPWDVAVNEANSVLHKYNLEAMRNRADASTLTMLTELDTILARYFVFAKRDPWKILSVETVYEAQLSDEIIYALRLDLLVEHTNGAFKGEVVPIDHKFTYNFWTRDELNFSPQLSKYIHTLNRNGFPAKRGIYNQLRYRLKKGPMLDNEMFRRDFVRPSPIEQNNVMSEQYRAAERAVEKRKLPVEVYSATALRRLNKFCSNCGFLPLCRTELIGEDPTVMLQTRYQPNTYTYNGVSEDE